MEKISWWLGNRFWLLNSKEDFNTILQEAVYSSYQEEIYGTRENWKNSLSQSEVRLQWDPDHNIYGEKEERRAIQLGIKGGLLEQFAKSMITKIIDMTPFVKEQKALIDARKLDQLMIPKETVYITKSDTLNRKLRIG